MELMGESETRMEISERMAGTSHLLETDCNLEGLA